MIIGSERETFYHLKILQCDEPSEITGRIYPREEVQKAIDNHRLGFGICGDLENMTKPPDLEIPLMYVSHKVHKMEIDNDGAVWCDIEILPTIDRGAVALELIDHLRLSPVMGGIVGEDNVVTDVQIAYTTFVLKEPTTLEQIINGE